MNEKDVKRFRTIVKILSVISLLAIIGISISLTVSVVLLATLIFLKESTVTQVLESNQFNMYIEPSSSFKIKNINEISDIVYDKPSVLLFISTTIIYLAIILFIAYFTYRLFKNMGKNEIFTLENSQRIKIIGYLFIALTVLYSLKESVSEFLYYRMFKDTLDQLDITMEFTIFQVNMPLLVSSLIIILIGYAFEHGLFLKNEYDQTI